MDCNDREKKNNLIPFENYEKKTIKKTSESKKIIFHHNVARDP